MTPFDVPVSKLVALAIAIFLLSLFSVHFVGEADFFPNIWLSNAVLLSAVLRYDALGKQKLLILFVGGLAILVAAVTAGFGPLLSIAFATADVVEVNVAIWLLRRFNWGGLDVARGRGLVALTLAAGIVAPLAGASLYAAAILAVHAAPPFPTWLMAYATDALGMLIVAPVALGLRSVDWRKVRADNRALEIIGLAAAITLIAMVALDQRAFLVLLVPIALLSAFRFGTGGAALASLVAGGVAGIFVIGEIGTAALPELSTSEWILAFQLTLATTTLVSMGVAAALNERDRVLLEASQAISRAEAQTRVALEAAEIGTWNLDLTRRHLVLSDRAKSILGIPITPEPSLDVVANSIYPEDRGIFEEGLARCLAGGDDYLKVEYRAGDRAANSLRWVRSWGRLDRDNAGRGLRVQGVLQDITWQKQAALERDDLLRRLIEAEEHERFRLAHELHDQTGQDLAAVMMELGGIEPLVHEGIRDRVQRLRSRLDQVSVTLHRVAWELRPASLDELGLSKAIATYVSDWADQCGIDADFYSNDDVGDLPEAIGVVIFRVVQEALTNIVKHARTATWASVVIRRDGPLLLVTVEDNGCGFDLKLVDRHASSGSSRALGLVGMRERLALIGGEMEIESSVGAGTTVFARIRRMLARKAA